MTARGARSVGSLGQARRYRMDQRIATGGMGEVWCATDTILGREVAVKVLKSEYADDPTFRSRFEAEARHAAALHHPGVASVFDFGGLTGDDGSATTRPFLVMELVPGQPLSTLLRGDEPMPAETAADLVAQAADAIAAAHALGIVHRDVKPANLMVTPDGRVKITDFGIARAADGLALTNIGEVIGTPHYLSPEQAEGKPATETSDIYALGVVLYECLAGHRPFTGATPVATALAHLREPVPPLPDEVPEHMRQVTMKALAKDPGDRFASAPDFAAAVRGGPVKAGAPAPVGGLAQTPGTKVLTSPIVPAGPGAEGKRRGRLAGYWPVAAAVVAVLLVIALVSVFAGDEGQGTAADEPPRPSQSGVASSDARVQVRESEYVGMEAALAKDRLEALGLRVRNEKVDNPGGNPEDTVESVTPHGLVAPDREITLFAWDKAPGPVEEPAPDGSGEAEGTGPGPGVIDDGDDSPVKGMSKGKDKSEAVEKHDEHGTSKGKK